MPEAERVFCRVFTAVCLVLVLALAGCSGQQKEAADYVNTNIGGIGYLRVATSPTVMLPHGMMRIAPITTPGITDRYLADKIYGFPAGGVTLMPTTGPAETDPVKYASQYDHTLETAKPYYYSADLENYDIAVEYTVTQHAAYYQIRFPDGVPAHVLFSVGGIGEIKQLSPTSLAGRDGAAAGGSYFYAEFSKPVTSSNILAGIQTPRSQAVSGRRSRDHGGLRTGQGRGDWAAYRHVVYQHRPGAQEPAG